MRDRARDQARHTLVTVLLTALITAAPPLSLLAQPSGPRCLHTVSLQPGQQLTLATVVVNDAAVYTARVLSFAGKVTTDDGSNNFARVWLKHTDLFHWGTTTDIPAGTTFAFEKRLGFVGKGMAEIRVRTANTRTTVCMCTEHDMDDKNATYPARHASCVASLREGTP